MKEKIRVAYLSVLMVALVPLSLHASPEEGSPTTATETSQVEAAPAGHEESREQAIERARDAFAEMDKERQRNSDRAASYIPNDVSPGVLLFHEGERWATLGASAQLWAVPLLGEDAMIDNGDAANSVGFRVRRLRLGFEGALMKNVVLELTLDPTHGDELIHDASISWKANPMAWLSFGTGKVPYSRTVLESSSQLRFVDRPFSTGDVAMGHRLGVTLEGRFWGGALGYVGGVYNGSEGMADGNASGGLLYGGRLESLPLGPLATMRSDEFRFQLGGGAVVEDGPTIDTFAWSGDMHVETGGLRARFEYLYDKRTPKTMPQVPSTLDAEVERVAQLIEITVFVYREIFEMVTRCERYDNNKSYEDFGDQQLLSVGLNTYLKGHDLKVLLHYLNRDERKGPELDNDSLVLSVVGAM